jgi:hypothetical protein
LLLLWDRILGFDSLEPLPLLAAGVFVFRGPDLLCATSVDDVSEPPRSAVSVGVSLGALGCHRVAA